MHSEPYQMQIAQPQKDLTQVFQLPQSFDWALCLEVAEHIPEAPQTSQNQTAKTGLFRRFLERSGCLSSWTTCAATYARHRESRPYVDGMFCEQTGVWVPAGRTTKPQNARQGLGPLAFRV